MAATGATIADVLVTQFSDTMFELAQQTEARFRPFVELKELTGEFSMENRVGSVEAQDLNTRSPRINPDDMPWDTRQLVGQSFGVPIWIDRWDAERMLTDPNSIVAMRCIQALERKFDRLCVTALTATVNTGRAASVPVTSGTDGVKTLDASQGFTYETILQLDAYFQGAEIETDSRGQTQMRKGLFISEQEHQQLMKEGTLTSRDYVEQRVVENGKLTRAGDFEVVVFGSLMPTPQLPVVNTLRTCFAVASGGLRVRLQKAWEVRVIQQLENVWRTTQITAEGQMGVVRMEGPRVQAITTQAY
jgi:hypothetical protein